MDNDEIARRKMLSFAQAEGIEPLPQQLQPKEVSQPLRALIWEAFRSTIEDHTGYAGNLNSPWDDIINRRIVEVDLQLMTTRIINASGITKYLLEAFRTSEYPQFYSNIQWFLRQPDVNDKFVARIRQALNKGRAAYRVIEGTLFPLGSPAEASAISNALTSAKAAGIDGARTHIRLSAEALTAGRWADSVRESIHAVESVAVVLSPKDDTLGAALKALERGGTINGVMKSGFTSLYAYTNSENGIRHALLEDGDANVSEFDALFMIGACASFVSYLINRGRAAGLLKG